MHQKYCYEHLSISQRMCEITNEGDMQTMCSLQQWPPNVTQKVKQLATGLL